VLSKSICIKCPWARTKGSELIPDHTPEKWLKKFDQMWDHSHWEKSNRLSGYTGTLCSYRIKESRPIGTDSEIPCYCPYVLEHLMTQKGSSNGG